MIISMLQKFIDEQGLSILELSKRSGVSRPTLTALASNKGKGIQFDTLERLCRFFHVGIEEMLLLITSSDCFSSIDDLDSIDFSTPQRIIRSGEVSIKHIDVIIDCVINVETPFCGYAEIQWSRKSLENDEIGSFISMIDQIPELKKFIEQQVEQSASYDLNRALGKQIPDGIEEAGINIYTYL